MKEIFPTLLRIQLNQIDPGTPDLVNPSAGIDLLSSAINRVNLDAIRTWVLGTNAPITSPDTTIYVPTTDSLRVNLGDLRTWVLGALDISYPRLMRDRGTFSFGGNWNNLTTPGVYEVTFSSSAGTGAPPATYNAGVLLVGHTGNRILQVFIEEGSGFDRHNVWARIYTGTAWQTWVNLALSEIREISGTIPLNDSLFGSTSRTLLKTALVFPYPVSIRLRHVRVCTTNINLRGDVVIVGGSTYSVTQSTANACTSSDFAASLGTLSSGQMLRVILRLTNPTLTEIDLTEGDAVTATFEVTRS